MSDQERWIERIHTVRRRLDLVTSLLIALPVGVALKLFEHGPWITLGIPLGIVALLMVVSSLLGLLLPKGQRYTPDSDWDPS